MKGVGTTGVALDMIGIERCVAPFAHQSQCRSAHDTIAGFLSFYPTALLRVKWNLPYIPWGGGSGEDRAHEFAGKSVDPFGECTVVRWAEGFFFTRGTLYSV